MSYSRAGRSLLISFFLSLAAAFALPAQATNVRLQTTQGAIDIELFDTAAPLTVANFLGYVRSGAFTNSLIHRSVPGFIIQGGGYVWSDVQAGPVDIVSRGTVKNEFSASRSNVRGTIAMAKLDGDPNSATSQWFINLADNSANLDNQNGGFTVFGRISTAGMAVVDSIAALTIVNAGGAFSALPLTSYPASGYILKANLSLVNSAASLQSSKISGVIDIDGNARHQIVMRNAASQMLVARLVDNVFQFSSQEDPGAKYRIVGVADLDGNGKSDLVFQDTTQGEFGDVKIWGDFQRGNERLWRQVKQVWDVQSVGDLDGDGFGDLVWRYMAPDPRDTGVSYIWFYNGANVPVVRKRGGAPLDWVLLGAADFNGDGAADMVYISPDSQIRVLMATDSRTCANMTAGSVPTGYKAIKMADFTGNARGDVLIRNPTTGQNALRTLNALGIPLPPFTGNPDDPNASCTASGFSLAVGSVDLPVADPTWQLYATGDFDGDGITDIVWLRPGGTLTLWLMKSNGATPTVIDNAGAAPIGYTVYQPGGGGAMR